MNQENNAYYTITPESIARERERLREKAQHDEAQALHHAEQKGGAEGIIEGRERGKVEAKIDFARNLIKIGLPIEQIVEVTGLSRTEVETLYTDR